MTTETLVLLVHQAPGPTLRAGERFATPGGRNALVVGRAVTCDIVLDDATVSRRHCELSLVAAGWRFRNLSISNGLFVDGNRVEPGEATEVPTFNELQVGGVLLQAEFGSTTVDVNSLVAEPLAASSSDPLFHFTLDVNACVVQCRGRLVPLAPSAAMAFAALAAQPGQVVHQWDIQEAVGTDSDLARLMSEVRSALRTLLEHELLSVQELSARVAAAHSDGQVDSKDLGKLLRRFVQSRRGHGYRVCLTEADVVIVDVR